MTVHDYGEALFGPQWQSPLARALGVNLRTVQRWASGQNNVPARHLLRLQALVREKMAKMREMV